MNAEKRLLIVAAHPDDEILGCGGTVARLVDEGYQAYSMVLGEGITSRDNKRDQERRAEAIKQLKKQVYRAGKIVGIKEAVAHDFPDNRFDTLPFLDIVKVIEKFKNRVRPDLIFTHFEKDLNIDHRITYQAVVTATRPLPGEPVRAIYSFEILSSTEWNCPLSFSPDAFFDIEKGINRKIQAMREYKSELRDFPHPRSLKGIKLNAEYWGMLMGLKYAEAFKLVRAIS
jgi:LmbE family N-acetylglucosaminyl deacetylase